MKKPKTPQVEDGFIQIATGKEDNDVLLALIKAGLNATEYQVCLLIIRKTWGFKKKEDWISLTQFMKYTGKTRASICTATKSLVKKNILVKDTIPGVRTSYCFNKKFVSWEKQLVKKTIPVKNTLQTSKENYTPPVQKTIPTKETSTKETITKENSKNVSLLIGLFSKVNPSYRILFKNKTQRAAAERLLDQYGAEKLSNLMNQLPGIISKPYAPTITTPYELEVKMGSLIAFMRKESIKVNKFSVTKI